MNQDCCGRMSPGLRNPLALLRIIPSCDVAGSAGWGIGVGTYSADEEDESACLKGKVDNPVVCF